MAWSSNSSDSKDRMQARSRNVLTAVAGTLLSGCLLALAGSLHPSWGVAWIASIPVLIAAFKSTGRAAWWLGLIAGLIGGLSVFGYYATAATLPIAVVVTVLKALLYAGGVRLAWGTRARLSAWIAVFAFPAWFSAFDVLIATFSANGTVGSLAYSQMNMPVALQVASFGGVPAVTFVICLFSAAVAHAIAAFETPKRAFAAVTPALLIVAAALSFGVWRISTARADPTILVAVAALDQESELPSDWRASMEAYRPLLAEARASGANVLVLPEEIAVVSAKDLPMIAANLGGFASDSKMTLAVGLRVADTDRLRNVLLLFISDGRALTYDKQHLVVGLETSKITPGSRPALIAEIDGHRLGAAICKDFDFVDVGRSLGFGRAGLVVAPAWDFGVDGWLHGRMAMLRGVEGGFSLVRSARDGTMSVSDRFGRVLAEAPSGRNAPLLVSRAPVSGTGPTIYARVGDMFGWACVVVVLLFMMTGVQRPRRMVPLSDRAVFSSRA